MVNILLQYFMPIPIPMGGGSIDLNTAIAIYIVGSVFCILSIIISFVVYKFFTKKENIYSDNFIEWSFDEAVFWSGIPMITLGVIQLMALFVVLVKYVENKL